MSSTVNVATIGAKITGDATGLKAALKDAEVQTGLSAAKIDSQFGELESKLSRRFSSSHTLIGFLKGVGIGSGWHAAELASEKIVEHWKEAAEHAKEVEESSQKQLEATLALIKAHRTENQDLAQLQIDRARIVEKLNSINNAATPMKTAVTSYKRDAEGGYTPIFGQVVDEAQVEKNTAAARELGTELAKIDTQLANIGKKTAIGDLAHTLRIAAAEGVNYANIKEITADDEERAIKLTRELDDELDKQVDKYRELGDPLMKYRDTLKEINDLEERGKLTGMEAARARVGNLEKAGKLTPNRAMMDAQSMEGADVALDKALEKTNDTNDAAKELGMTFSSAFEDAIVSGRSLGDVLQGLEQDLIRIALRKMIIEPLVNSFASYFTGGHAGGGDVGQGTTTLVGENGPELFTPNVSGAITPNSALRGGMNGTAVYNIDARGADRTGLARLEAMIRETRGTIKPISLAASADHRRRAAA